MTVITAPTDAEARAKLADYQRYASYDGALALYGGWSGLDLSSYDPDQPLRYVRTEAVRSAVETFTTADPAREWTPREIARFVGIGGRGPVVAGGPGTVADEMGSAGSARRTSTASTWPTRSPRVRSRTSSSTSFPNCRPAGCCGPPTMGRRYGRASTGRARRGCATITRAPGTGGPMADIIADDAEPSASRGG